MRALAVTVSNRAAAGVYEDRSGPVLAELLRTAGCAVDGPVVITLLPGRQGTPESAEGSIIASRIDNRPEMLLLY